MLNMITLAPYCMDEVGHYVSYHSSLQGLKQGVFAEVLTYLAKEHTMSHLPSTWKRFFQTPKSRLTKYPVRLRDYIRMYRTAEGPTLFFVESFSSLDFIALLTATFGFTKKEQFLCVVCRDSINWHPWKGHLQSLIARGLRKALGSRYMTLTDSEVIAETMRKNHPEIRVLPIPHTELLGDGKLPPLPLTLWFAGTPVISKGLATIQKLVRGSVDDQVVLIISELAELPNGALKIERVPQGMPRDKYLEILSRTHVVLFPYDAHFYGSRTSGPFVEAIVAGKWIITTKGTWMAYELSKFHLEVLIVDWDRPSLLDDLQKIMKDPEVQEKLHRMRGHYQNFHSKETFGRVLKEIVSNWNY